MYTNATTLLLLVSVGVERLWVGVKYWLDVMFLLFFVILI